MIDNIKTIGPSEGETLAVVGDNYRVVVSGKQTGGAYAVIDMLVPPGGGPGPHAHAGFQELFYVVDGEVEFKTEAGKYTAEKGATINIPMGGAVHCFKNTSDRVAHLLCTVIPSGLEEFFEEVGTPVGPGVFLPPPALDAAEIARLTALAEKHGQKVYPPHYLD
jgi:quercetin dioxygenase-like cupin family protein